MNEFNQTRLLMKLEDLEIQLSRIAKALESFSTFEQMKEDKDE